MLQVFQYEVSFCVCVFFKEINCYGTAAGGVSTQAAFMGLSHRLHIKDGRSLCVSNVSASAEKHSC